MKNLLSYFLFAALIFTVACNSASEKETSASDAMDKIANGASDAMDKAKAGATDAMDKVADGASDAMDKAKSGAADAMDKVADGTSDAMDKAKAVAGDAMDKAKTGAGDAMDKAKTGATDVMDKAKSGVSDAMDKTGASDVVNKAKTGASNAASKVKAGAADAMDKAKAGASAAVDKAKNSVPVAAAPAAAKEVIKKAAKPAAFSHAAWNTLAQKHISSSGKVNYKGFKADNAAFDAYLKSLADNPIQSSWSRGQKMAYWINAYNAFTIKLIVDNYPVKSITDLEGGKPWDKKWIKLGGKTYSLNNIEHDILRPQYKDARIHFAVNCAAKSCPPVWNKAWTAANLNGQLEKATKAFINSSKYNNVGGGNAEISKIFEWYAVDFGDITSYLNKYASTKVDAGTTVSYKEYNWALNE